MIPREQGEGTGRPDLLVCGLDLELGFQQLSSPLFENEVRANGAGYKAAGNKPLSAPER